MAHSFSNILIHAIFSTKGRIPAIDEEIGPRLFAYLGGIIRELKGTALEINGPVDHVHILLRVPHVLSISDAMRLIKTNSSRWVHETWPARHDFARQTGYGAFSVSQSGINAVREYIVGQQERHRTVTFQQEFVAFLRQHGIEYDERYLWE